jgi:hypothetical protein
MRTGDRKGDGLLDLLQKDGTRYAAQRREEAITNQLDALEIAFEEWWARLDQSERVASVGQKELLTRFARAWRARPSRLANPGD